MTSPQPSFSDGCDSQVILLPYFSGDTIHKPFCCLVSYGHHPTALFLHGYAARTESGCLFFSKGLNIQTDPLLPDFSKDKIHSHPWPSFFSGPDTLVFISQPFLPPSPTLGSFKPISSDRDTAASASPRVHRRLPPPLPLAPAFSLPH